MKQNNINSSGGLVAGGLILSNEDNMTLMARYPDKHFDLAIVDLEYGIGASKPSIKPNTAVQKMEIN